MADSDKDILITPNVSQTSQPEIKLVGKDNSPMYLKVLDDNTLSFEGAEGQVFSIGPTMSSGDIFSVNDISGIQSMAVNADGTITMNAQTQSTTIKNSASNTSTLILSNNNADAVDGPILEFFRDSASPADNDHMGSLVFTGRDDAGNKQEYGRLTMHNDDATAASSGGELVLKLTEGNSDEQEYMRWRSGARQIEINSQLDDIDFCYNSDATADFFYINANTQKIGIGDAGTAPSHLVHIEGIDGGNGELFIERASGAGILLQAQSGTGVVGTNTNHPLALKSNGTTRVSIASGGAVTFNSAYTFPTSDGSANQVLQTDGSGALSFATVSGGSDTNTFVIVGEESDNYSGTGSTGNANGYQFSYGNGAQNVSKSSSGADFGINLPVNCTLTRVDVVFANSGNVSSGTTTFVVVKNGTSQSGNLSTNHSAGIHDTHHTGLSHSFSAGDRFNLRTTTSSRQVGPMRMTAYFTPT